MQEPLMQEPLMQEPLMDEEMEAARLSISVDAI